MPVAAAAPKKAGLTELDKAAAMWLKEARLQIDEGNIHQAIVWLNGLMAAFPNSAFTDDAAELLRRLI